MWLTQSPDVLRPGLQVHIFALGSEKVEPITGVLTNVDNRGLTFEISNCEIELRSGDAITAMGSSQGSLLKFQSLVEMVMSGRELLRVSTPSVIYRRSLRRHVRLEIEVPCKFREFQLGDGGPNPVVSGYILNVSKGGALLGSRMGLQSPYVHVTFQLPSARRAVSADCNVRHVRQSTDESGVSTAGLQFVLVESTSLRDIEILVASRMGKEDESLDQTIDQTTTE